MIYILGAGAMGCLWAAHLQTSLKASSPPKTTPSRAVSLNTRSLGFISTRPQAAANLEFSLHSPFLPYINDSKDFSIPVYQTLGEPNTSNIILVCTKSYDALPALNKLKKQITPQTCLVLFQNGLGSQHAILEAFPNNAIFAAVTTEGVNRVSPSKVIHAGQGLTSIGALNAQVDNADTLDKCLSLLAHPGINLKKTENIWCSLWNKLAINCAINPFTALLNCPNGELMTQPYFQTTWPKLKQELALMLDAAGYPCEEGKLEQIVYEVIDNTKHNISSMLQDIRLKKQTEINDINGFAYQFLKSKHLAYQDNQTLCRKVQALHE